MGSKETLGYSITSYIIVTPVAAIDFLLPDLIQCKIEVPHVGLHRRITAGVKCWLLWVRPLFPAAPPLQFQNDIQQGFFTRKLRAMHIAQGTKRS